MGYNTRQVSKSFWQKRQNLARLFLTLKKPYTDCFVCTGLLNIKESGLRYYAGRVYYVYAVRPSTLLRGWLFAMRTARFSILGDRHSKQSFFQKWADCPLGKTGVIANWWFKTAKWTQLSLVFIALNENLGVAA